MHASASAAAQRMQGVSLEEVHYLAGHPDPPTTLLYDRSKKRVTRSIVERISI